LSVERSGEVDVIAQTAVRLDDRGPVDEYCTRGADVDPQSHHTARRRLLCTRQYARTRRTTDRRTRLDAERMGTPRLQAGQTDVTGQRRVVDDDAVVIQAAQHYQSCSARPPHATGPIYKIIILRQSYDYLTIMPKLRSTYDGRLIYKTSYEERKDFLMCNSLSKS